jgi:hypothetical protein
MTVEEIRARVEKVRALALDERDNEDAHGEEDDLYRDVLRAIAAGQCEDPAACAAEAVKTAEFDYDRWYA